MHSFRSQLYLGSFLNEIVQINRWVCVFFSLLLLFGSIWKTMHLTCFCTTIFQKVKCERNQTVYAREQMKLTESIHTKKNTHTTQITKKKRNHCKPSYCFIFLGPRARVTFASACSLTVRSLSLSISVSILHTNPICVFCI